MEHKHQAVKDHFKPRSLEKRVPIEALLASKFHDSLSDAAKRKIKIPSDFDHTLIKAHHKPKKSGKTVPQLGTEQKIFEPLQVQTDKEKHAMEFMQETGFTYEQAAKQTDDNPFAEVVGLPYEYGKPFITDDEEISLGTQMHKFYRWYLQISKEEDPLYMFGVKYHTTISSLGRMTSG
jgi:hypothetical protein